jgi:hypothetical protein
MTETKLCVWIGAAFLAALTTNSFVAAEDEDEIVGRVWEMAAKRRDGAIEKRKVVATPDGKLRGRNAQEIGTWEQDGIEVTMKLRYPREDAWNGVYNLVQVGKDPPSWKGTFYRNPNAKGIPIPEVKLLRD